MDFHRKYFHPANMIAAVSGAFSRAGDDPQAGGRLRGLAGRRGPRCRRSRRRSRPRAPGLYRIEKDIPQGRVIDRAARGRAATDPDVYALEVMNEILGG